MHLGKIEFKLEELSRNAINDMDFDWEERSRNALDTVDFDWEELSRNAFKDRIHIGGTFKECDCGK